MTATLSYRLLEENDYSEVSRLLKEHYAPNYPFLKYLGGGEEDIKAYFLLAKGFLRQGNSLGAFNEHNKLCGLMINAAPYLDEFAGLQSNLTSGVGKALSHLAKKMVGGSMADVSKILGTGNYWEMKMGTVDPKYKGLGVMDELFVRTKALACKKGVKKLISYSTFDPTEEYLKKLGPTFYVARRINLKEYVDPDSGKKIFAGMKPPHTSQVMIVGDIE